MESKKGKVYIIDHQEGGLLDWCQAEYFQMIEYTKESPSKVIVTNAKTFKDDTDCNDELKEKIKICNDELEETIKNTNEKFILLQEPVHDLVVNNEYINILGNKTAFNKVCLLDMKAEKLLSPEDSEEFDVFVFGGILGDIPSKDRTSYLRSEGFQSRHLGEMQMSTDTALLTTKLIIENGLEMKNIPFIDEPEFFKDETKTGYEECICMEGFRFISNELNPHTGEIQKKEKPKPLGHKNIYEKIIFEEINPALFI